MGSIVEGAIALMGLVAAMMVAFMGLLSGGEICAGKVDTSDYDSRTICPCDERMAA